MLIEKVSGIACPHLCILGLSDGSAPKEATCKGGLMTDGNIDDRGKCVILKATGDGFADSAKEYGAITNAYEDDVVDEVSRFFDFIFVDMNKAFNFSNNFQMSQKSLDLAKDVCKQNLDTYLAKALDAHRERKGEQIEETAFFYPVKGALYALTDKIFTVLHSKEY